LTDLYYFLLSVGQLETVAIVARHFHVRPPTPFGPIQLHFPIRFWAIENKSPLPRIFPLFQFSCHVRKSFLRVCARVRVCVFIFRHIAAIECKQKSNNDAARTWAGGEGSRLRMGGRGRGFWRESKRTQQFDAIKTKWAQGEWDSSVRPTVGIAYHRGVRRGVEKTPECLLTFFQNFFYRNWNNL